MMRAWNALSKDIRDAPSLGSFKKEQKIPTTFPPRYFDTIHSSREGHFFIPASVYSVALLMPTCLR